MEDMALRDKGVEEDVYIKLASEPALIIQVSFLSISFTIASQDPTALLHRTRAIMNLIIIFPFAFALFASTSALPATVEATKDVDFHAFPEFAGLEDLAQLVGNDTLDSEDGNEITSRDPAAAQAGQCTLANLKKTMFDYSKSFLLVNQYNKDVPSTSSQNQHISSGMSEFQSARNAKSPSCFDWYSNKCTLSPDRPLGFDFIPPCQRHDFGDTNFAKKNQWNPVNKARTDWRFRTDLWAVCDKLTGWKNVLKRATCVVVANKYADAVVMFDPATDL